MAGLLAEMLEQRGDAQIQPPPGQELRAAPGLDAPAMALDAVHQPDRQLLAGREFGGADVVVVVEEDVDRQGGALRSAGRDSPPRSAISFSETKLSPGASKGRNSSWRSIRDGVRTARETAAQSRVRSSGCQAMRRLGRTSRPVKLVCSSLSPAISDRRSAQPDPVLHEAVIDPQPTARRTELETIEIVDELSPGSCAGRRR